jgi:propionyl-CoA carboxylase beta chain
MEIKALEKEILAKSKNIREFFKNFLDEFSFVETDTFSYGKRDLFGNEGFGEGVVTGYAAIDGIPVCLFAQNYDVCKGGMSKGQADKILKIQKQAEKTGAPLISVIDTAGVKVGEGITALEGYAEIIAQSNQMYGVVPQIAIIKGTCNGAMSYFAALNDFVIFVENASASTSSPKILTASSANVSKDICSAAFHQTKTGLCDITVKENELPHVLKTLLNHIYDGREFNPDTDFNKEADFDVYNPEAVIAGVFDENTFIEIGKGYTQEIICGIARIGGVSVGALLCAGGEKGIYLKQDSARKAARFIRLLDRLNLPLISFVNCAGINSSAENEQTTIITDVSFLMSAVNDFEGAKISVICGRACGAGYVALASKSLGFDNCIAWTNSVVSPLSESAAALIEYADDIKKAADPVKAREEAEKKYAEIQADPFNSAKEGSVDNIIEPSATRQYLISMLMMLI